MWALLGKKGFLQEVRQTTSLMSLLGELGLEMEFNWLEGRRQQACSVYVGACVHVQVCLSFLGS